MQLSRLKYVVQSYKSYSASSFFVSHVFHKRSYSSENFSVFYTNEESKDKKLRHHYGFIPYHHWMDVKHFNKNTFDEQLAPDTNSSTKDPPGLSNISYSIKNIPNYTPYTKELPLVSNDFQTMSQIDPRIRQNLVHMNIHQPNELQKKAIALFDAGYDFTIQSFHQSGKTVGCLLPLVSKICQNYPEEMMEDILSSEKKISFPTALILCSSKWKIASMSKTIRNLLTGLYPRLATVFPDKILNHRFACNILVATPAMLPKLLEDEIISLKHLKYLLLVNSNQMNLQTTEFECMFKNLNLQIMSVVNSVLHNSKFSEHLRPNSVLLAPTHNISDVKHNWESFDSEDAKDVRLVELINELDSEKPIVVICRNNKMRTHFENVIKNAGIEVLYNFPTSDETASNQKQVFIHELSYTGQVEPVLHVINTTVTFSKLFYSSLYSLASSSITNLFTSEELSNINSRLLADFEKMMKSAGQPNTAFFEHLKQNSVDKVEVSNTRFNLFSAPSKATRMEFKDKHIDAVPRVEWLNKSEKEVPMIPDTATTDFQSLDGLHPVLANNLKKMNVTRPSTVQQNVYNLLNQGHSIIAQSERTSGKTLAYLVPIINNILKEVTTNDSENSNDKTAYPLGLILVPTNETMEQAYWEAQRLMNNSGSRVVWLPHHRTQKVAFELSKGCQLLIGTAPKVFAALEEGVVSLSNCKHVVLDDVDSILVKDRICLKLVMSSQHLNLQSAQMALFSDFLDRKSRTWAVDNMNPDTISLTVGDVGTMRKCVQHHFEFFENETTRQSEFLKFIQNHVGEKILVICSSRFEMSRLTHFLKENKVAHNMFYDYDCQTQTHVNESDIVVALQLNFHGVNMPPFARIVNFDLPSLQKYVTNVSYLNHKSTDCSMHTMITSFTPIIKENAIILNKMMNLLDQQNDSFFEAVTSDRKQMSAETSSESSSSSSDSDDNEKTIQSKDT